MLDIYYYRLLKACHIIPLFTGESKCLPVNPCKNGGVCTEDLSGYKCSCKDGYNGINCEGKRIQCNRPLSIKVPVKVAPYSLEL